MKKVLKNRSNIWVSNHSTNKLIAMVVCAVILVIHLYIYSPILDTASASSNKIIVANYWQNTTEPNILTLNSSIEFELGKGNTSREFQIQLNKDEFIRIDLEQINLDIASTITDTSGHIYFDSNLQTTGIERIYHIAPVNEIYKIKINLQEGVSQTGKVIIKVPIQIVAGVTERQLLLSQSLLLKGADELSPNTKESTEKAISIFNDALSISEKLNDNYYIALISDIIAKCYYRLGDFDLATSSFIKSLINYREIKNAQLELVELNNIGLSLSDNGKYQEALIYSQEALALAKQLNEKITELYALNNLGKLQYSLGNINDAINYTKESLALSKKLDNKESEGLALGNLGVYSERLIKYQDSIKYFTQATTHFHDLGNSRYETFYLNNLGKSYLKLNQPQIAIEILESALAMAKKLGDKYLTSVILINLCYGYTFESNPSNASKILSYLNEALTLSREIKNLSTEIGVLIGLSEYYETSDKNLSLMYIQQALTRLNESQEKQSRLYVTLLLNTGRIYASLGDYKKCIEYSNLGIDFNKRTGILDLSDQLYYYKAIAERKLGNLKQAFSDIEEAVKLIEANRLIVTTQDLRTSLFAKHQQQYEFYIDVKMNMQELEPTVNHSAQALQLVESSRARSLLDLLQEANIDIRQDVSTKLLDQEANLKFQFNRKIESQLKAIKEGANEDKIAILKKDADELKVKLQVIEAEIKQQSPRFKSLSQIEPLSVQEIQQQVLDKDTVLLEYFLGKESSYLWLVTPTSIDSYTLPNSEQLEKISRTYIELLIHPFTKKANEPLEDRLLREQYEKEFTQASTELSDLILAPVLPKLKSKRLIVIPDGILQYIPFVALPVRSNRDAQESIPLIANFEVLNLPSATTMAILKNELKSHTTGAQTVAVFADPVFELQDNRIARIKSNKNKNKKSQPVVKDDQQLSQNTYIRSAFLDETARAGINFKRLKGVREEALKIQSLAIKGTKIALDFDANLKEATRPELNNYSILHFATHGFFNSSHPELSGLVLSLYDKEGNEQPGFLTLNHVYNLKLSAELVVLSACRSGLGKEIKGEGIVGLNRGFLYSGAKRIIYSLWNVNDQSTALLMEKVYIGMLKEGKSPSTALRDAQLLILRDKRWNAPYYWAAFQIQGLW